MFETASLESPITEIAVVERKHQETRLEAHTREITEVMAKLPQIADNLVLAYKRILDANQLSPGKIELYLVGGRAKGKPINEKSDIDLVFVVENPEAKLEDAPARIITIEGMENISLIKSSIRSSFKLICQGYKLENHFHIISFGKSHKDFNDDGCRLLAEID